MARQQKTQTSRQPGTKKQAAELPDEVKKVVGAKISEVETAVATIRRRSEAGEKLKQLAIWLKSDQAVTPISQEKTPEEKEKADKARKGAREILEKAADNLLKKVGVKVKGEKEEEKDEVKASVTNGEGGESSDGGGSGA